MKPLFNEYEAYNEEGGQVSDEIQKALFPIMKKWAEKGYSVKDIEAIVIDNVAVESAFIRAKRALQMRKMRKKIA